MPEAVIILKSELASLMTFYRKKKNISQAKLSSCMDVNHGVISRWEKGERRPTHTNLLRFSRALSLTLDETCALEILAGYLPVAVKCKTFSQAEMLTDYLLEYLTTDDWGQNVL